MLKNELIVNGTYKEFLQFKKELFQGGFDSHMKSLYEIYFDNLETVEECFKIYYANRQRKKNNWNEICKWLFAINKFESFKNFKIVFGTLTFKDKVLENTNERTRTRYITKFLSEETYHYIANVDYGSKNNREHYHFIAMIDKKIDLKKWKHGSNKVSFVPLDKNEIQSIKNYLLKLNNHSYKESTKQRRILRDRNLDNRVDLYAEFAEDEFHKFRLFMSEF